MVGFIPPHPFSPRHHRPKRARAVASVASAAGATATLSCRGSSVAASHWMAAASAVSSRAVRIDLRWRMDRIGAAQTNCLQLFDVNYTSWHTGVAIQQTSGRQSRWGLAQRHGGGYFVVLCLARHAQKAPVRRETRLRGRRVAMDGSDAAALNLVNLSRDTPTSRGPHARHKN